MDGGTPKAPATEGETCTWRGALKTVAADAAGTGVMAAAAIAPLAGMTAVATGGAMAPEALTGETVALAVGGIVGATTGVAHALKERVEGKCAPSKLLNKPTGP